MKYLHFILLLALGCVFYSPPAVQSRWLKLNPTVCGGGLYLFCVVSISCSLTLNSAWAELSAGQYDLAKPYTEKLILKIDNLLNTLFLWVRKMICWIVFLNSKYWEFPGRPVVMTLCFHCQKHEFDPWSGN